MEKRLPPAHLTKGGSLPEARQIYVRGAARALGLIFCKTTSSPHHTRGALQLNSRTVMGSIHVDDKSSFSGPYQLHALDGILLAFDGTIIDSTAAIDNHSHK